jgi:CPA1 family monovalent cation:H+ antiporter
VDHTAEILLALLVAISALSTIARLINVPYPILLVVGGLAIGLIPGMPEIELEPDLVLVLFLPPLLYSAAFFASLRDLRANLRPISLMAIGLVVATAVGVAVVAHFLIDGMSWGAAFALGAIVAPTDPIAATAIARRQGAPREIVSIIEGESLINDGTALVLYAAAVTAVVAGDFSIFDASADFVVSAIGGVAVGLAVGWPIAEVRKRLDDPPVEITISLATAYAAYLPAEELGVSGVLAAVTTGIYLGWRAPEVSSANMRTQGRPVWELLQFLLNAILFILVGLQLPVVAEGLDSRSAGDLALYAALVCFAVTGVRFLWVNTVPFAIRALDRRPQQRQRRRGWRFRSVVAWSGMRGSVSLAAALALPLTVDSGAPFPERDLIIFLAFAVILFTLVVQGLTLPKVIEMAGFCDDRAEEREELHARLTAADAALVRLDELALEEWTRDDTVERVRRLHQYRLRRFEAQREGGEDSDGIEDRSLAYQRLTRELLQAQHRALVGLRNEGTISNEVMLRIERELDLEDSRLEI